MLVFLWNVFADSISDKWRSARLQFFVNLFFSIHVSVSRLNSVCLNISYNFPISMERNIRSFTLVLWLAFVASLTMGLYQLSEGYFPRPVALSGFASHDEQRDIIWHKIHHEIMESTQSSMEKETLEKKVGKVVLIIIDALRYDFAAGSTSAMSFLKSLIRDSRGCAFPAFAHPPTVTLPRLKALTSGSVPNFLDVILNFASGEFPIDNLIAQFTRKNKTVGTDFIC